MKFDFGVKTVRADFLSNHTLSLTFSEHPVSEGMMEHLKDIVNDLISEHGQKIRESQKKENKDVSSDVVVLFELENFDDLISFVKNIKLECRADTTLYKDNDKYYLSMDLSGAKEDEVKRMSVTADEYVNDIMAGVQRKAYFDEHADVIIKEKALQLYEKMCTIREFEELVKKEYLAGNLPGFVHLYIGEEAVASGICGALEESDYIESTHRGHGHCIAKGADLNRMMAEIYGKKTGLCKGKGGSMHIADFEVGMLGANGVVGGGYNLAAGAALANSRIRKCPLYFSVMVHPTGERFMKPPMYPVHGSYRLFL